MESRPKSKRERALALARARHVYTDKIYNKWRAAIHDLLDQAVRDAASRIAAGYPPVAASAMKRLTASLRTVTKRFALTVASEAWSSAGLELGLSGRTAEIQGRAAVSVGKTGADMLLKGNWKDLDKWVATTAESASATTAKRLQSIFEQASAATTGPDGRPNAGITPRDMAAQIMDLGEDMTEARAKMLAHTGAIWAYNEGAVQRYKAEGVAVIEWLTTDDDLDCPFCAELNGKRIKTGDTFLDSGEEFEVPNPDKPGETLSMTVPEGERGFDISHPPAHPNCRCTLIPIVAREQLAPRATLNAPPRRAQPKPEPGNEAPAPSSKRPSVHPAILKYEDSIGSNKLREEAGAFTRDGKMLFSQAGSDKSVPLTPRQIEQARGAVLTHNHLTAGSFSIDDIDAAELEPAELRVVDPHYRYSLQSVSGEPITGAQARSLAKEARALERQMQETLAARAAAGGEVGDVEHELWSRLATRYGLKYTRERR